ncbi:hypothetical protein imdm_1633 [gamma proteobacterium IMCC2047]|nr:hypothetical protein imdm_1633 [gamma proteobacterium IMCC2047]
MVVLMDESPVPQVVERGFFMSNKALQVLDCSARFMRL